MMVTGMRGRKTRNQQGKQMAYVGNCHWPDGVMGLAQPPLVHDLGGGFKSSIKSQGTWQLNQPRSLSLLSSRSVTAG